MRWSSYSRETRLVQTLAGAGAVTTISFAPLSTTEGDGLVMGLLEREAKFCVLVKDNYSLQADTLSLDPPRRFILR